MASLRKKPNSKFWIACFKDHNGKKQQKSTKSEDKSAAQRFAFTLEDAYRRKLTEDQLRRVLNDASESINGRRLVTATVDEFFARWLTAKASETSKSTHDRYGEVLARFQRFLGPQRCAQELNRITVSDCTQFRDHLAKTVKTATANLSVKILSVALKAAWRESLVTENPAAKVVPLKSRREEKSSRRAFTVDELKKVLEHANNEWKGIILSGAYTGQRLGDIVRLTWRSVDLDRKAIRFETQKTGRVVLLPLAPALLNHLIDLPAPDDPDAPVFQTAYAKAVREKRVGNLSNQFYEIQVAAGLADKKSHKKAEGGEGRDAKHKQNALVFHSLRHTFTSWLKNSGASEAVAMDMVGHDSSAISQNYTHIDDGARRRAMARLPDITKARRPKKPRAKKAPA